jgi:hypothetical protein
MAAAAAKPMTVLRIVELPLRSPSLMMVETHAVEVALPRAAIGAYRRAAAAGAGQRSQAAALGERIRDGGGHGSELARSPRRLVSAGRASIVCGTLAAWLAPDVRSEGLLKMPTAGVARSVREE